jgi:hypothetical protein
LSVDFKTCSGKPIHVDKAALASVSSKFEEIAAVPKAPVVAKIQEPNKNIVPNKMNGNEGKMFKKPQLLVKSKLNKYVNGGDSTNLDQSKTPIDER